MGVVSGRELDRLRRVATRVELALAPLWRQQHLPRWAAAATLLELGRAEAQQFVTDLGFDPLAVYDPLDAPDVGLGRCLRK